MDITIAIAKNIMNKRIKGKSCDLCQIPYIFDEVFLCEYYRKLFFHLQQIFDTCKTLLCCFLDDEFHYRGRDWYKRKTWSVSQSESIAYSEKLKMNEINKSDWVPFFQKNNKKLQYAKYI